MFDSNKTWFCKQLGYTGAVKPPVRMTGNRESGHKETGMCAAEPPSRRRCFSGWAAS